MKRIKSLAILLMTLSIVGSFLVMAYAQTQTMTIDTAVQLFKDYLDRIRNPDLILHEVEEYQNNFYATYVEKSTGIFAFQMLIWKPGSFWTGGMMGNGMMSGVVMPEPGPNIMWNTKYGVMEGMMGIYRQVSANNMTITPSEAKTIAQQYLDNSFSGTTVGDVDTFYGYYNVDVLSGGKTFGMLSVNGYSGQVWYHSWHGAYIQTVTIPVPDIPLAVVTLIIALTITGFIVRISSRRRERNSQATRVSSKESVHIEESYAFSEMKAPSDQNLSSEINFHCSFMTTRTALSRFERRISNP